MLEVYPSIDELIPEELQGRVPASLYNWIVERYDTLGEKYLTEELHVDGRRINSCMNKSSVQDALEEVVDATFNILVWLLKLRITKENSSSAYSALIGLCELYSLLKAEQQ